MNLYRFVFSHIKVFYCIYFIKNCGEITTKTFFRWTLCETYCLPSYNYERVTWLHVVKGNSIFFKFLQEPKYKFKVPYLLVKLIIIVVLAVFCLAHHISPGSILLHSPPSFYRCNVPLIVIMWQYNTHYMCIRVSSKQASLLQKKLIIFTCKL